MRILRPFLTIALICRLLPMAWMVACSLPSFGATFNHNYWVPFRDELRGPSGTINQLQIVSFEGTNIVAFDYDHNGTIDEQTTLGRGQSIVNQNFVEGTHISSTSPLEVSYFYVYSDHGTYEDGAISHELLPEAMFGTDYWLPITVNRLCILSPVANNQVFIDRDHDGTPDESSPLAQGQVIRRQAPAGTHIWSLKPIYVVGANHSGNRYDETFAFSLLPRHALAREYYFPRRHPHAYPSAVELGGVHVIAVESDTAVNVNGSQRTLQAGEAYFFQTTAEGHVAASKNIFAVYKSRVQGTDPWAGVNRFYEYALLLVPADADVRKFVLAPAGSRSTHGNPGTQLSVVSLRDNNLIRIDCGGDGAIDFSRVLQKGQFLYFQESDSILSCWSTRNIFVESDAPVQVMNTYRGWWNGISENTWGNAVLGNISGVIVDTNRPPTGAISIGDVVVREGNSGTTNAIFNITLSSSSSQLVSVSFGTANGAAIAGSDYAGTNGVAIFNPGDTNKTIVVGVFGDILPELSETFFVVLTNASNGTIARSQGIGTILNDDTAPAVTLLSPTNGASFQAPVNLTVAANASDADGIVTKVEFYQSATKLGEDTTAPYSLVWSNVSAGNYTLTARAVDNAGLSATSGPVNITVVPPCARVCDGMIAWWQADGDVQDSVSGTIGNLQNGAAFLPGLVRQAFSFDGNNDLVRIPDSDQWAFGTNDFTIELWARFLSVTPSTVGAPGDILMGNVGTVRKWFFALGGGRLYFHVNGPPAVSLAQAPFSPVLGQWYHLAVTRSNDLFRIFVNGVVVSSESSLISIPNPNASLTIGWGQGTGYFHGQIDEATVFNRALANQEIGSIHTAGISGKCGCQSSPPSVTIADATVREGNTGTTNAVFSITLSSSSSQSVSVNFGTANGTAIAGSDYAGTNGVAIFNPGETNKALVVSVAGDTFPELDETFFFVLTNAVNATIARSQGIGTILNDDIPPAVTLISPTNGASFQSPANLAVAASASDPDGIVSNVEFYQGTTKLGEDPTAPYSLVWSNVLPGNYTLTARAVDNAGLISTSAAVNITVRQPDCSLEVYRNDFQGAVGSEWSVRTTDITPLAARRFLGQFGNQNVTLNLSGLPLHSGVSISFDLFLIRSWDGNRTDPGPDVWRLELTGGSVLVNTTFNNVEQFNIPLASKRQSFPGAFPGGDFPARSGAAENNSLGYVFTTPGTSETHPADSVYHLTLTTVHSASSLSLTFSASNLQTLADESWGLDNVIVRIIPPATPPVITAQPTNQTVAVNSPAQFSVGISSPTPVRYQWRFNGIDIPNQTNATLTIASVQPALVGNYSVAVGNCAGTVVSDEASLAINLPPTVRIITPTNNATFTAGANIPIIAEVLDPDGTGAVVVFLESGRLLGFDNSAPYSLVWSNVPAGNYTLIARAVDEGGLIAVSPPVNITVGAIPTNTPPTLSSFVPFTTLEDTFTPPIGFAVTDRETSSSNLVVMAASSNPVLVPPSGVIHALTGTNRTLTLTPAPDQFGVTTITVTVRDPEGLTVTNSFVLTVTPVNDPPTLDVIADRTISENAPEQLVQLTGISAGPTNELQTLMVTAMSDNRTVIPDPTVTYVSPNTTGSLRFQPLPGTNGVARVTVTVADNGGTANGGQDTVTRAFLVTVAGRTNVSVCTNVTVAVMPDQVRCGGSSVTFTAVASGTGPLTFHWKKDGVAIPNATNNSFTIPTVASSHVGTYLVEVTGPCNTASTSASLAVGTPVSATMPASTVVCSCSDDRVIGPVVTGIGPFHFVWKKDGIVLAGQTSGTLSLGKAHTIRQARFTVEITGSCNSVTNSIEVIPNNVTSGQWTNASRIGFQFRDPFRAPSTILVRCAASPITELRVMLRGLHYHRAEDLDILLVGPNGEIAVPLMSDAGGNRQTDVDLTFDDNAAEFVPYAAEIFSRPYQPTNYVGQDTDESYDPAPPGPYATRLSDFYGSDPNGTWSLYIFVDHAQGDIAGSLDSGWVLDFGPLPSRPSLSDPRKTEDGSFQMKLNGEPNMIYFIEASTDMQHWELFQTHVLSGTSVTIIDTLAPQFNRRFYRANGCRN